MSCAVVHNISQLVTLRPLVEKKQFGSITRDDLGILSNAWVACKDGKIEACGMRNVPWQYHDWPQYNADKSLVIPGLIDAHTHPVFAGSRASEFSMKLEGKSYQDIAAAGGGIISTVKATRAAPKELLLNETVTRLKKFLSWGVTTLEVKSGYGLSVKDELKLLEVLNETKEKTPQTLSITCLALHGLPPEQTSHKAYIDEIKQKLIPLVIERKLADSVDVFIEKGYFSVEDVNVFMKDVTAKGLNIRVHADEFSDAGAASAAGRWHAVSADHLECVSEEGIEAMVRAGVVAILLPGTSLYSKIPFAKARPFLDKGCPVALATDYNPGSCVIDNLPFIATLGAIHCGLTLPETLVAITYAPALSLKLNMTKGALVAGFDADFVISSLGDVDRWLADIGRTPPKEVWIAGEKVIG